MHSKEAVHMFGKTNFIKKNALLLKSWAYIFSLVDVLVFAKRQCLCLERTLRSPRRLVWRKHSHSFLSLSLQTRRQCHSFLTNSAPNTMHHFGNLKQGLPFSTLSFTVSFDPCGNWGLNYLHFFPSIPD